MSDSATRALRIVFAGTPDFAVPSLEACVTGGHDIVAVYTQPDRPSGRGRRVTQSAVKQAAQSHGLPVHQPRTLRDAAVNEELAALAPDLAVVAAYGLLLPQAVLDIPRLGCVNVHASLLPRWRGAAPVQHAILAGDAHTGVTLMQMEAGLDCGPMLAQAEMAIDDHVTGGELTARLAGLGAGLLATSLPALAAGELIAVPQDESLVTLAPKIGKRDGRVDWRAPAARIARAVRAFAPWPGAQTMLRGRPLRIWRARAVDGESQAAPGTVVAVAREHFDVACGDGSLRVTEVQAAGKRRMSVRDFCNSNDLSGAVLGDEPA